MALRVLRLVSLILLAIVLAAALAHIMEMSAKLRFNKEQYFLVQRIYNGWALTGIALIGAIITTGAWAVLASGRERGLVSVGAVCIALGLAVFLLWTLPANHATNNWTVQPDNWEVLRQQWEYSHAAAAGLYSVAYILMVLALVRR